MNPLITKYAALSLSAVAATLSVVALVSGGPSEEEVNAKIASFIDENPQKIVDSVNKMFQEKQSQESESRNSKTQDLAAKYLENNRSALLDNAPTIGSKNAKLKIIKFADYRCGYCRIAHEILEDVLSEYSSNDVALVLKQLPILDSSDDGLSHKAAKAAIAVYNVKPDNFAKFHSGLFSSNSLTEKEINKLVYAAGLSDSELRSQTGSSAVSKEIKSSEDFAKSVGMSGTPAFMIGDKFLGGLPPAKDKEGMKAIFKAEIDKQLKKLS